MPATRPKAKARPAQNSGRGPMEMEEAWPVEPPPYQPPPLAKSLLVGRAEALERRASNLRDEDPRLETIRERMQETERWLKEMGGRTGEKMPFAMLDGKRKEERCRRGLEKAKEELGETRRVTAQALAAEGRAEAELRAWEAKLENCKNQNAYVRIQAAVDGLAGVDGFNELAQSLAVVGALAAANGSEVALHAGHHVENFILQFQPKTYNEEFDPYLQDLESSSSEATTVEVGGGRLPRERDVEEDGEEGRDEGAQKRTRTIPAAAFETAITAEVSTRFARLNQAQEERVEQLQVQRIDTPPHEEKGGEENRNTQGRKEKLSKKPNLRVREKIGKGREKKRGAGGATSTRPNDDMELEEESDSSCMEIEIWEEKKEAGHKRREREQRDESIGSR